MTGRRGFIGITAAFAAAMVCMVGAAWACTVFATGVGVNPAQAPERGLVRVEGEGLASKATAVELRWDGANGTVLGNAPVDAKGRFAAEVGIPVASPGIHYVVAVAKGAGLGRAAVEVLPATSGGAASVQAGPAASPSLDPWSVKVSPIATPHGSGLGTAVGTGLLSGGLLALFAGTTVVAVGRRRAKAVSR